MSYQKRFELGGNGGGGPFGSIAGILVIIVIFLALFYITKIVFKLLWFLSPLLFIASLIIDHNVFLGYAKWIGKNLRSNPLLGIGTIVLSALLFPLTASFLFGKALFKKKLKDAKKEYENKTQGELIEFEEIAEDEIVEDETLELPPVEKEVKPRSSARQGNEYDNLFD